MHVYIRWLVSSPENWKAVCIFFSIKCTPVMLIAGVVVLETSLETTNQCSRSLVNSGETLFCLVSVSAYANHTLGAFENTSEWLNTEILSHVTTLRQKSQSFWPETMLLKRPMPPWSLLHVYVPTRELPVPIVRETSHLGCDSRRSLQ